MAYILPVLLSICELVVFTLAYQGADLPPGPYCFKNNIPNCCTGRVDNCSHPILDSICYCDEFCYRPMGHDDCCPDYLATCASYITTTSTPTTTTSPTTNAIPTTTTTTTTITTTTTAIPTTRPPEKGCSNTCDYDSENEVNSGQCAEDSCIINNNVIFQVNRDESLGWRAANYSQFYDKKLKDGIIYKLGTFKVTSDMYNAGGISYDTHVVDKEFDSRIRWPDYISPVADQGWCGSDWAVSLATIASDRFGIQSNGAESVRLSAQALLSCNYQSQKGCEGGHVDTAWKYAKIYGLVEEHCFPYEGKKVQCPYKLRGNLISDGCKPLLAERKERYTVGPLNRLASEQAVMFDIITSGPILAVMTVYQDFFHYSGGIYRHSRYGDQKLKGYHSVRVLGWGEENGQKYWIVANSWGTEWGENGYFRIARGSNESGIESLMVSALSDVLASAL